MVPVPTQGCVWRSMGSARGLWSSRGAQNHQPLPSQQTCSLSPVPRWLHACATWSLDPHQVWEQQFMWDWQQFMRMQAPALTICLPLFNLSEPPFLPSVVGLSVAYLLGYRKEQTRSSST